MDVYCASLVLPAEVTERLASLLSVEERAAAARFVSPERQERARVAWAARRAILAAHLACAPSDIVLARSAGSPPRLAKPTQALHFSLSHSGDYALLAVSYDVRLGADIQRVDQGADVLRLAGRFARPSEVSALNSLPRQERAGLFFRLWARKEAVLKATGGGVPSRLRRVEVPHDAGPGPAIVHGIPNVGAWIVQDLEAPTRYVAALATSSVASVVRRSFDAFTTP